MRRKVTSILIVLSVCINIHAMPEQMLVANDSMCSLVDARQAADSMIFYAKSYLGCRYGYGKSGPTVFDCSGFTQHVYNFFGYSLPHSAVGQSKMGRPIEGSYTELQKGDILIFGSRNRPRKIGHVGIFIEMDSLNQSFTFIHAARSGIIISEIKDRYYIDRFLGAVRILPDFSPEADFLYNDSDTINNLIGKEIEPIKLQIDSTYKLILMSSDGTWAYVDENGQLQRPSSTTSIVLSSDRWREYTSSLMSIPSIPVLNPVASNGEDNTQSQYYIIKQGDTLSAISRRYNTSVQHLCAINNIQANSVLRIGQKIRIK